ncbi:MAG: hypothetical protein RL346_1637 [Verrucomicrobiota bacterium]|jgi:ElaB/YqjD/DUF883 family membrane-anchored ribosome-binding protein
MSDTKFPNASGTAGSPKSAANDLRAAAGDFVRSTGEQAVQVKERALEVANSLKASALDKAEQFRTAASDKAQYVREVAQQQWEETRVRAKEIHVTTEDYIRQNPTKAVLGALGVGFLIGLIVRR